MKKKTLAQFIRSNGNLIQPIVLVRVNGYMQHQLWEIRGQDGQQHGGWYTSFNGNAKQRRQQQRKLIRDLNQE